MRCKSCDCLLTDEEATLKSENLNDYLDLCYPCIKTIDELDAIADVHLLEDYIEEDPDDWIPNS